MSSQDVSSLRRALIDFMKQNANITINFSYPNPDDYIKTLDINSRIIYKLNGDKTDYIVGISSNGEANYFFKGIYGGYISKSPPQDFSSFYLVTTQKEKIAQKNLSEILGNAKEYGDLIEVIIYKVKYKLIEIETDEETKERYILIKKIRPTGREYDAEAYEMDINLGERKRDGINEEKAEILKAKYAALLKLPFYVAKEEARKYKWDTFYLRLKVVTSAPELIKPASQIIYDSDLELDLFEGEQGQEKGVAEVQETTRQGNSLSVAGNQESGMNVEKTTVNQESGLDLEENGLDLALRTTEKPVSGYVELFLLDFNLPSKYIAKLSAKAEKLDENTYKIETLVNSYLARKVENVRRSVYEQVGRYFANTSIGWVAVNDKGVKVAKEINESVSEALKEIVEKKQIKIRKQTYEIPDELVKRTREVINKYYVKAIRILLKYEDAKYIIENVINQLKEGIEELRGKIEKAEQEDKKALAKVYEYNVRQQQLLLDSFKEFYAKKFGKS